MQTILKVEDMHCDHCVQSIQTAVFEVEGVSSVIADLTTHQVTIEHDDSATKQALIDAIQEHGFDVAE